MFLSTKYVLLYTGAGLATGFVARGDKTAAMVGMGLAALVGFSFGLNYAIVSAIEFGVGFGIAVIIRGNKSKG